MIVLTRPIHRRNEMDMIFEFLIAVVFEWFLLLPSKVISVARGGKFSYKTVSSKDYYLAFAFWALVLALILFFSRLSN